MVNTPMAQHQFVTFWIGQYLFGVNILNVLEINNCDAITPVPMADSGIRGLINLRGQIVTVLDLKYQFGLGHLSVTPETHNIILKSIEEHMGDSSTSRVGFMVDKVGDIITVEDNQMEPPPANTGEIDSQYLLQVVKLEHGVASIINIKQLLRAKLEEKVPALA
jgi:purine-binding chemotaxis protein CheW